MSLFRSFLSALGALIDAFMGRIYKPQTDPMPEPLPPTPPVSPPVPPTVPIAPQTVPILEPLHLLLRLCEAIRDYEGKPGALNYQLNNPGDCRPSPVGYLPKYGHVEIIDTNTDPRYPYHKGKFAKFPTYALGWEYLQNMVHVMAVNHPTWNLLDFFGHFAPSSDKNDPNKYAAWVADKLDVDVHITLQALLG